MEARKLSEVLDVLGEKTAAQRSKAAGEEPLKKGNDSKYNKSANSFSSHPNSERARACNERIVSAIIKVPSQNSIGGQSRAESKIPDC
jgi:hypothetical protein